MKVLPVISVLAAALSQPTSFASPSAENELVQELFSSAVAEELGAIDDIDYEQIDLILVPRGGGGEYLVNASVNLGYTCKAYVRISRFGTSVSPADGPEAPLCVLDTDRSGVSASNRWRPPHLSCFSIDRSLPAWNVTLSKPNGSQVDFQLQRQFSDLTETYDTQASKSVETADWSGTYEINSLNGQLDIETAGPNGSIAALLRVTRPGVEASETKRLSCRTGA